ncbi:hypothetical protein G5V59_19530 [Nocardioides sp. W3-2-3]|uniref:hypothetical protein n=1 Tax=Nocardioides convexus TaxID=2712224 RepID=UPI0024186B47|nr:hypothetical protein [Nocardioides convexus]NHA01304.1 hypothetical protein [Nocardioides convexus]
MASVGVKPSVVGTTMARVGEVVGRLKPNGHLFHRAPLTDVVESRGAAAGRGEQARRVRGAAGLGRRRPAPGRRGDRPAAGPCGGAPAHPGPAARAGLAGADRRDALGFVECGSCR